MEFGVQFFPDVRPDQSAQIRVPFDARIRIRSIKQQLTD
jgi:hypothetical protein